MPKKCTVKSFNELFSLTHVGVLQPSGLHVLEDEETGAKGVYAPAQEAKGEPNAFRYKNTALVFVRNYNPLVDTGFYR